MSLLTDLQKRATTADSTASKYLQVVDALTAAADSGETEIIYPEALSTAVILKLRSEGLKVDADELYGETSIKFSTLVQQKPLVEKPLSLGEKLLSVKKVTPVDTQDTLFETISTELLQAAKDGLTSYTRAGTVPDVLVKRFKSEGVTVTFDGPCRCGSMMSFGCTCDGSVHHVTMTYFRWQ